MEEVTQTTYNFILLHNQHYNYYIHYEIFEPILQSFTGTAHILKFVRDIIYHVMHQTCRVACIFCRPWIHCTNIIFYICTVIL